MEEKTRAEKLDELVDRVQALEDSSQENQSLKDTIDSVRKAEMEHNQTFERALTALTERVQKQESLKDSFDQRMKELSDIVSRPEAPDGTTTETGEGIVLPDPHAPPEAPPEVEEPPEETPEESSSEAIKRIAEFLKD